MGRRLWTDEEVLEAIRTVAARKPDGSFREVDYLQLRQPGEPSPGAIRWRFLSWPAALERAGLGKRSARWLQRAASVRRSAPQ